MCWRCCRAICGRAWSRRSRPARRNSRSAASPTTRRQERAPACRRRRKRRAQIAEVFALFDHVIESSKAGVRKPDPRIYQMMCDALGVEPPHCVYLDDLGINLKPARDMGMATIKVGVGRPAACRPLEGGGSQLRLGRKSSCVSAVPGARVKAGNSGVAARARVSGQSGVSCVHACCMRSAGDSCARKSGGG